MQILDADAPLPISCSSSPSRSPLLAPQTAERLVDVPTVLSVAVLQHRTAEQITDIPVPGRGGGDQGCPQGFPLGQGSTASAAEQTVGFPSGGPHGFLQGQASRATVAKEAVVITTCGGPRGFLPGHDSAASGAAQNVDLPAGGGQVSTAFPGAEHGHDAHGHGALHGSRRGGGAVVGPQGSVPGQSSTARGVDAPVADSSEWVQFRDAATRSEATSRHRGRPGRREGCRRGGLALAQRYSRQYMTSFRCLLLRRFGVRGLASPHPFLGANTAEPLVSGSLLGGVRAVFPLVVDMPMMIFILVGTDQKKVMQ